MKLILAYAVGIIVVIGFVLWAAYVGVTETYTFKQALLNPVTLAFLISSIVVWIIAVTAWYYLFEKKKKA